MAATNVGNRTENSGPPTRTCVATPHEIGQQSVAAGSNSRNSAPSKCAPTGLKP